MFPKTLNSLIFHVLKDSCVVGNCSQQQIFSSRLILSIYHSSSRSRIDHVQAWEPNGSFSLIPSQFPSTRTDSQRLQSCLRHRENRCLQFWRSVRDSLSFSHDFASVYCVSENTVTWESSVPPLNPKSYFNRLIVKCKDENPTKRPTFTDIRSELIGT